MFKDIGKPTLVLILIATVIGVLLAFTYNAAGVAELAGAGLKPEALAEAIPAVLPSATELKSVKAESEDTAVMEFYRDEGGAGYAVLLSVKGYSEGLKLLIGISPDAAIAGAMAVESGETPTIGGKALKPEYLQGFVGKSAPIVVKKSGGDVDAVAGATITSQAVGDAMNRALAAYEEAKEVLAGE